MPGDPKECRDNAKDCLELAAKAQSRLAKERWGELVVACTPHETPAGLAAHDSRPADTIDHVHTRAAGMTDLSDHVVRLM